MDTLPFTWRGTTSPNDEDFTFPLTIVGPTGFVAPFLYDGVPFTEIQVSCNGFLKFCNSVTGDTLSTSKTTGATNNMKAFLRNVLAPLWDDLASDVASVVQLPTLTTNSLVLQALVYLQLSGET